MTTTQETFARLLDRTAAEPENFEAFRDALASTRARAVSYTPQKSISSVKQLVQMEEALKMTTVKRLTLKNFKFIEQAVIALCMGLESPYCGIHTLELVRMNLSGDQAIALSKALHSNLHITQLNLRSNTIGGLGAVAIAAALKVNTNLTDVDLSLNFIDNYGAIALGEMLTSNWTLRYLQLEDNQIDDTGAERFVESLPLNLSLLKLNLSGNKISRLLKSRLKEMMNKKSARQKLASEAFYAALDCPEGVPWMQNKLIFIGDEDSRRSEVVDAFAGLADTNSHYLPEPRENDKPNDRLMHHSRGVEVSDGSDRWNPFSVFTNAPQRVSETASMLGLREFERVRRSRLEKVAKNETGAGPVPVASLQEARLSTSDNEKAGAKESRRARRQVLREMFPFNGEDTISVFFEQYTMYVSLWEYSNGVYFNPCMSHLFFQGGFVFVLVFNMSRFLDSNPARALGAQERFCKWLEQVQTHSPSSRVFIIGTRTHAESDELSRSWSARGEHAMLETMDGMVKTLAKRIGIDVEESPDGLSFWQMDMSDGAAPTSLRRALTFTLREHQFTNLCAPLKWLKALELLLSHSDEGGPLFALKELREQLLPFGDTRPEELERMLSVFSELGAVVYSKHTHCLREVVITNPRWLFEQIRKLESIVIGTEERDVRELYTAGLLQDQSELLGSGVATKDLLQHLWGGKEDHVEVIINFLMSIGFAGEWKSSEGDTTYLLPTMSTNQPASLENAGAVFTLRFKVLPEGIYPKIVCQFIATIPFVSDACAPILQHRSSTFWLSETNAVVIRLASTETIEVSVQDQDDALATLHSVEAVVKRIKAQDGLNLNWDVQIEEDGELLPVNEATSGHWRHSTRTTTTTLDQFEGLM